MKLYLIDFKYIEEIENEILRKKVTKEMAVKWCVALESREQVHELMKKNISEFEKHGYRFLSYSFRELTKTDNGYNVILS